jgi:UDP-3-O-[3-hydroxymyristoyl] N-acetylglucosamine deacetylase
VSQIAFESEQHTLAGPAVFAGVGLHTGRRTRAAILPAPADTGILFLRTDVEGDGRIEARAENVASTRLSTVIGNASGVTVSTVEHLMAALYALGVDNALVELDGPEAPIMDGSAAPFVSLIDRAGRRRQDAPRQAMEILEPIEIALGDKRAALVPADRFELLVEIAFDSPAIGRQRLELEVTEDAFRTALADCRTFGFLHEVEALRSAGLAQGGSLDNAIVVDGDSVINPEGLKRPDEFVRHKAVDAIGDLATLGRPLIGRYEGRCAGHALNNALARALLERPGSWRLTPLAPAPAQADETARRPGAFA